MNIEFDDREFQSKLKQFTENLLPEMLAEGMERACLIVQNEAQRRCPVDDGTLRGSITHKVITDGEINGVISTNIEYAPYVHEGTGIYAKNGKQEPWRYKDAEGKWHTTKGQKPNPFLKNAVEAKRSAIIRAFKKVGEG